MLPQQSLNFMVADGHPFFKKGLVDFLLSHYSGSCVDEALSGEELFEACKTRRYDIILIDVKMPEMSGAAAAKMITRQNPEAKIIAVSVFDDEMHMIDMFESGAAGYLPKSSGIKEITETIANVLDGNYFVGGKKMNELLQRKIREWRNKSRTAITEREKEILLLLCDGFSSKEIAERLFISIKTVENHRSHLLEKTNTRNVAGLVMYALKRGWV
jgi:DNA-binding NarL/FixJ family response regulator